MITFRIKQRYDDAWVPDHEELENQYSTSSSDPVSVIRQNLFAAVDSDHPGEYTLEWPVADAKVQKLEAIEQRTFELLDAGFEFGGVRYGMSASDQAYYNLLRIQQYGIISGLTMTYPVKFASSDGKSTLSAANSAALANFLNAQGAQLRQVRDGDVALKTLVKDATTTAQVEAITDSR